MQTFFLGNLFKLITVLTMNEQTLSAAIKDINLSWAEVAFRPF